MERNAVHDRPIDFLVVMHGGISKTYRLFELPGQELRDDSCGGQRIERLSHRVGWRHIQIGNEMCAEVHAQLHGSRQIQGDNIL